MTSRQRKVQVPHTPALVHAPGPTLSFTAPEAPRSATLHWRKLGARRFAAIPLAHAVRGIYTVNLPAPGSDDFEYYIQVEPGNSEPVCFPATAPTLNQTVIVCR